MIPKSLTSSNTMNAWYDCRSKLPCWHWMWNETQSAGLYSSLHFFPPPLCLEPAENNSKISKYADILFCVQIHAPSCPAWRGPAAEWVHPSCCIPGKCRRQEGPRQLQGNLVKVVFIRQQWNWKWEHIFKTMSNYNNHGFLEVLKGGSVSSNELLKVTMYEIQHLFASLWVFWQLCKRLGMI